LLVEVTSRVALASGVVVPMPIWEKPAVTITKANKVANFFIISNLININKIIGLLL
jgi:hypothetical protein